MKYLLYSFLSFLLFVSCSGDERVAYTQVKGNAQGTTFNIVYDDPNKTDYSNEIDSVFRVIDRSMSLWDSLSTITKLNASDSGLVVDSHFANVYLISKNIYERTHGSFDITMGPLIKSWGFIRKNQLPVPPPEEIEAKKKNVGMSFFVLEKDFMRKLNPLAEIDMNAVAQGYSVDVLAKFLELKGIKNYLVEVGGELKTAGVNQFNQAWNVGIEKPDFNSSFSKNSIKAVVGLSNKSLATSGSYRKFIEVDGKKYSHTIDPTTGSPVTHNLLSVTVIADNCADADAYATAFMVMGRDSAMGIAQREKLEVYCIFDEDGTLKTQATKGFEELLVAEN